MIFSKCSRGLAAALIMSVVICLTGCSTKQTEKTENAGSTGAQAVGFEPIPENDDASGMFPAPSSDEDTSETESNADPGVLSEDSAESGEDAVSETTEAEDDAVFDSVSFSVIRDDRSLTADNRFPSENNISVSFYFDKIHVAQDNYPYSDSINEAVDMIAERFLTNRDNLESMETAVQDTNSMFTGANFWNYSDINSLYNRNGLLSVLWKNEWMMGGASNERYYSAVFNLETGREMTLDELLGETGDEALQEVKNAVSAFIDEVVGDHAVWNEDSLTMDDIHFYINGNGDVATAFDSYQLGDLGLGAPVITIRASMFPASDTVWGEYTPDETTVTQAENVLGGQN